MHNNLPLSLNYVQNIIGAPLYDPHIPPEHLATTEPVTNCLKETVGVENNVVYIIRDGRHAVSSNDTIYRPIRETTSAEDDFANLDDEDEHASFRPDLSRVTRTLEELKPQSEEKYSKQRGTGE